MSLSKKPILDVIGESMYFSNSDEFEKALQVFCNLTNQGNNTEVSLVFCTSEEMVKINRTYRGANHLTDVLSFPAEKSKINLVFGSDKINFLGEILIDTNYITGHKVTQDMKNEIIKVFIHGLLHLVGYDHLNASQKNEMNEMELKIFNNYKQDGIID